MQTENHNHHEADQIDIIPCMSLTLQEVEHIAQLARLQLTDEEKALYQQQLSDILDHVAQLQQLDTSDIPPTSSVLPPRTMLREDHPKKGLEPKQALKNSASKEKDQFRVPPVLD